MALTDLLPPTSTRVEISTNTEINESIRRRADAELERFEGAGDAAIGARVSEMAREWDVERVLQANAGTLALTGSVLALTVDRRFAFLPAAVFAFFMQHSLQGWCPPIPVLRRLGVRTQREIERERNSLKALRGDFDGTAELKDAPAPERVRAVLRAVDR